MRGMDLVTNLTLKRLAGKDWVVAFASGKVSHYMHLNIAV
jgi:hypothetical protein